MTLADKEQLVKTVCAALDNDLQQLDEHTQRRLDDMRSHALARQQASEPEHASDRASDREEALVMAVQVQLDESVDNLGPALLKNLERARKSALNVDPPAGFWQQLLTAMRPTGLTAPVKAFATASVLITVATLLYQLPSQPDNELADTDVLLFASSDELELYDNLEFYLWLADNGLPN